MGERGRTWGLTPRALSAALLSAVLYGVLSWVTKQAALRGSNGIELRPAIVIPIIVGACPR